MTGNQTYLNAASQSLDFIRAHLYNDQHVVEDTIVSDTCKVQAMIAPFNSAYMIEGMSILCSITSNQSTTQLLRDTLAATIYNKAWQKDDGIISYGSGHSGDWAMVHALSAVYRRNSTAPDLREYIRDYLTVQYNALLDSATAGSNIYGGSWIGPPGTQLDPSNQTSALTVLISAITLENTTSSAPPPVESSDTPPNPDSTSSTRSNIGGIVGGAVGGTLFLVGLGVGIWWLLSRRRHRQQAVEAEGTWASYQPVSTGTSSDYSVVSPTPGHSNQSDQLLGAIGGAPQSHQQKHLAPARRLAPTSSSLRSEPSASSDRGISSVNELAAELHALRLQQARLQERIWEEEDGPPPEYFESMRSPRREQHREGKGR
ncbi:hypothetical protein PM082_015372 [Marasmius tenuissimus]|nr:hypothetical protein PM082_015372 [Marasmius tenuissimus]